MFLFYVAVVFSLFPFPPFRCFLMHFLICQFSSVSFCRNSVCRREWLSGLVSIPLSSFFQEFGVYCFLSCFLLGPHLKQFCCVFSCVLFFWFWGFFLDVWVKNEMGTWCGIEMSEHNGVCILITHQRRGLANQPWMDLCRMSVSPSGQSNNHEISSVDSAVFHLFPSNLKILKALSSLQITFCHQCCLLRSSLAFHLLSSVSLFKVSIK